MSETPWYLLKDADDCRPMTPAQAADWLCMKELGYADPEATLANWSTHGKIPKSKLGNRVIFNLRILRAMVVMNTEGLDRAEETKSGPAPSNGSRAVLDVPIQAGEGAEDLDIRQGERGSESTGGRGIVPAPGEPIKRGGTGYKLKLNVPVSR